MLDSKPKMIVKASASQNGSLRARGNRPPTVVRDVATSGRNRRRSAVAMAAFISAPSAISWLAKSTSRIELLTAIPIKPRMPSITKKLSGLSVISKPPKRPKKLNGIAVNTSIHWVLDRNWMINKTIIAIRAIPNAIGNAAKASWLSDSKPKSKPSASSSRPIPARRSAS